MAEKRQLVLRSRMKNCRMEENRRIKIVSLHGYNSSHDTGFEAAMRDAFSGEYDFECVNLLGHAPGRDVPEFYSISEVVSDAVGKISRRVNDKTFLIGTSFGAYPVLEYLRKNSDVSGAVFVKPMVDIGYTFAAVGSQIDAIRGILDIEEVVKNYPYGTRETPFSIGISSMIFSGRNDDAVGDVDFVKERVVGGNLQYRILEGGHSDNREEDVRNVVAETRAFFAGL